MEKLGGIIMEGFAESLGLKRTYFIDDLCQDHFATAFVLHYPEVPK